MRSPTGVFSDGTKLYVADYASHRVIIWNTIPTTDHAAIDEVWGGPDVNNQYYNYDGMSAYNFYYPWSVRINGFQGVVSDMRNHRVSGFPVPQ